MKLDTLIKHDETMCHAQQPLLLLSYLWSYFPLIIFIQFCVCSITQKTIRDFSMKLDTLIKHDETMCHAQQPLLLLSYLWSYFPLIIFHTISCPLYNLKTVKDISMKFGTLIKRNEIMCHAKEP